MLKEGKHMTFDNNPLRYVLFIEDDEIIKFWDTKESQMYLIRNESIVHVKGSFGMHAKFHPYAKFEETDEKPVL